MPYSSIIALIDVHLDRLHKARTLLTSTLGPDAADPASPARAARKAAPAHVAPAVDALPLDAAPLPEAAEAAVHEEPAKVAVQRLPAARLPRGRRQTARKIGHADPTLSALGGTVPAAPVYVSAKQVRDERTTQPSLTAATILQDAPTVEMLARRWLTSSAS